MTRAAYFSLAFGFWVSSSLAQTPTAPAKAPPGARPPAPAPPPAPAAAPLPAPAPVPVPGPGANAPKAPTGAAPAPPNPGAPTPPPQPNAATSPPAAAPPAAPPPSPEGGPAYYYEPATDERLEPEDTREPPGSAPPRDAPRNAPPYYGPRLVWEPPPPPEPRHTAPRTSFWLGGRVGWFVPFGNAFSKVVDRGSYLENSGIRFRDYAASGPFFEVDIGARFGRHYNVFGLWERAELGIGNGDRAGLNSVFSDLGGQTGGDTDFWAAAVRISSDPDAIGLVSELALGYRRARIGFEGGEHLELTDGSFEARIGVGADIRVNRRFSLSPMLTLGVGMFGEADLVRRNGTAVHLFRRDTYDSDGHGWFTLHLGGHFDLAGRR